MTSLVKAIQERLAKICEEAQLPSHYQWGDDAMEQFDFGKERAAKAIRAADLSDLEPKEGATPRTDAVAEMLPDAEAEIQDARSLAFNLLPDRTEDDAKDDLCEQVELLGKRYAARLEAAEGDARRLDWLEKQYTLHKSAEITYVVDGYDLALMDNDGDLQISIHHGASLRATIDDALKERK